MTSLVFWTCEVGRRQQTTKLQNQKTAFLKTNRCTRLTSSLQMLASCPQFVHANTVCEGLLNEVSILIVSSLVSKSCWSRSETPGNLETQPCPGYLLQNLHTDTHVPRRALRRFDPTLIYVCNSHPCITRWSLKLPSRVRSIAQKHFFMKSCSFFFSFLFLWKATPNAKKWRWILASSFFATDVLVIQNLFHGSVWSCQVFSCSKNAQQV